MVHRISDRAQMEAPNRVYVDGEKIDKLLALMEPVHELAVVQLRMLRSQYPDAFRDTVDPTLNRSAGDASSTPPFRAIDEPPSGSNQNLAYDKGDEPKQRADGPNPAGPRPLTASGEQGVSPPDTPTGPNPNLSVEPSASLRPAAGNSWPQDSAGKPVVESQPGSPTADGVKTEPDADDSLI